MESSKRRDMELAERRLLEASLKLLKVMSFLRSNRSLISEQGMQFIMKGGYRDELRQASPGKGDADM